MPSRDGPRGLLRGLGVTDVRPVELFFDLVYILAVTQLTHHLLNHLSWRGAGETLLLLLAVWIVWIHVTWTANYFDLRRRPVQLLMLGLMLASLVMSASLSQAMADRGLAFAAALVTIQLGATVFQLVAGRGGPLQLIAQHVLFWIIAIGVLWIVGGLLDGDARLAIWSVAVVAAYAVTLFGFPVPGFGRARSSDYTITGSHMAHRSYLFIIIALGESILIIGSEVAELPVAAGTAAAFVVAFLATAALWWIYFDRAEEAALDVISTSSDPGRLGVIAYTYCHIPMVAGIIVAAAANELVIGHPTEPATLPTTLLILGGPALYLVGHALFKLSTLGHAPRPQVAAIGGLVALAALAPVTSNLVLACAATLILLALVVWDLRVERSPGVA